MIKASAFSQIESDYSRFVDSAEVQIHTSIDKAQLFLDSIPLPLEDHIGEKLPEYYTTKGHIYSLKNKNAIAIESFLLAAKYADRYKKYEIAGDAHIQLFRYFLSDRVDSLPMNYLNKAKYYFELSESKYGIYEIEIIESYFKNLEGDYSESNKIVLKNIDKYKKILDEDAYLYADACVQLVLNYIELDSINKSYFYINEFKNIEGNPTISENNFYSFEASINVSLADYFLRNKLLDSSKFYLRKAENELRYLDDSYVIFYYNSYIDYYRQKENLDLEKAYLDSLALYENKLLDYNLNASIQIGNSIEKIDAKLKSESKKGALQLFVIILLVVVSIFLTMLYFYFYRKNKFKLNDVSNEVSKLSYLKSNNEKLTVKVQGLEEYINNLKQEVKEISKLDGDCLRERIRAFYTNLHHNSTTILDKTDNHLELVNDLNADFFNELSKKYPQLNDSEIIICYYLFIGFKNKEIAVFLNSSVRAIESKRYRITKKMSLEKITLSDYLNAAF